jgi:Type II secretion system (T2SS), protein G
MELINSKRLLYTASYVNPELTEDEQSQLQDQPAGAFKKANLLLSLGIRREELEIFRRAVANTEASRPALERLLAIAQDLVMHRLPIRELSTQIARVPEDALLQFGKLSPKANDPSLKLILDVFDYQRKLSPVGWLHLERIEMYPAGVQKGELVFTVPMAPGETVTISHKEWSTSTQEFEDIVQDYFESYSERGVAEKTDASMSTESEAQHSSTMNFGASLSGGFGGVTLTTTFGLQNSVEERESVKNSLQKNREVTERASARTRKEHKISVKLETKKGVEDSSFRTISNQGNKAVRIDYYRMMRKWRTDLYRYGLRLTYDIAIPVPGGRLWAQHKRLAAIETELRTPLAFVLQPNEIKEANYQAEALKYDIVIDEVPPPLWLGTNIIGGVDPTDHATATGPIRFGRIDFDVPAGYRIETAKLIATVGQAGGSATHFKVLNQEWNASWADLSGPNEVVVQSLLPNEVGTQGHRTVTFAHFGVASASITIHLLFKRLDSHWEAWQRATWRKLRTAAEARYQEAHARLQEERDRLFRLLHGKDTLSLRRLEREELLRLVMQWLLGPSHPILTTLDVQSTIGKLLTNEDGLMTATKVDASPTFTGVSDVAWYEALVFGEMVKFIHQAVEWENLLYFLYPYFWGSEDAGRAKLLFEHNDAEHQRFLRAGYARIVLTVRPGFEEDFTRLVETGSLGGTYTSPYMTIATEIANFAQTNYAGIPPANPEQYARPLLFPEQRATWEAMQQVSKDVRKHKELKGNYPKKLSDLAGPVPLDAWGNPFVYRLPGLGADFDLVSLGSDNAEGGTGLDADISSAAGASLIATWHDYTPTSGIDIEVDTKPDDIA